jgi:hypothetical protein
MEPVVIAFALCILVGVVVGRWWTALAPFAVLAAMAFANLGAANDQTDIAAGLIVVAMLGAVGAVGTIFGVALHKAVRREPSAI